EGGPGPGPSLVSSRRGGADQDRDVLVGRRGALEALVPGRPPGAGAARLLRRAVLDRRGRLDVLPRAGRADGAGLGGADTARVRDARQGVRPDDPPPREARAGPARPA